MTTMTIRGGLVFDGTSDQLAEHPIHIENGEIVGHDGPAPDGAVVIDAAGGLVTPGFIDCHLHANAASLDLLELEALPASYVAAHAARRLSNTLRRGFTTVRDPAGGDLGIVRAIEEGLIAGPRYLFVGRALTQTGGHADPRPGDLDLCCGGGHMGEIVDGVDALRAAVRERFRTGAHAIKVFTSGGVVSPTDPLRLSQYSAEELAAVCDEAARRESYVIAHAYSPDAIVHAIDAGVRSIEHGNLLDGPTAKRMAEAGAYLVPTLITYDAMARRGADLGLSKVGLAKNEEVLAAGQKSLEIARAEGVPIGLGTDLMGHLENEQLDEFRLRVAVESVADVLRSATSVNARIIQAPELGTTAVGTPADLVVFAGNPFEQPELLWSGSRTVVRAGEVVPA